MKKLAVLVAAALPLFVYAQTDDFNDGTDQPEWTRYDPIKTHPIIQTNIATFSLTNGAYRIQTYPSPNSAFGPARAGSIREDVLYEDFYITIDIVNWNTNLDQAFGLLARVSEIGLGSTVGYALTWDLFGNDLDISWFTNEEPDSVGVDGPPLVPGKIYRLAFKGVGAQLSGSIYELPNMDTPLTSVTITDDKFLGGFCGLIVYDNAAVADYAGTDVTFDNYSALPFQPPRLRIEKMPFEDLLISWPAEPTNYVLQATSTLGTGWTDITDQINESGGIRSYIDNATLRDFRFYRLRP